MRRSLIVNPTLRTTASLVDDAPRAASIGEIVVFVDGQTDPRGIMEFAGVLAQEYDAHLTGVFMRPAPAVADAMPLLVRAAAVEVLVIDPERRGGDHGQEPGADIARYLARHGAQVQVRRLSSDGQDVGRLLLSQAAAFGADLLVMGAYGHARLNELIFGGVTRTALHDADLPVLMSR